LGNEPSAEINFISLDLVGGNLLPMCNDEPLPAPMPDQAAGVAAHLLGSQGGMRRVQREEKIKRE
jgi:hypothetical protein